MAKTVSKSKVVSGSTKKSSGRKLSPRLALFGLVGILAFSTLVGFGWQKWQDHQLKAKAAGWTQVWAPAYGGSYYGDIWISACKINATGPNYYVKVYARVSPSGRNPSMKYVTARSNSNYSSGPYYSLPLGNILTIAVGYSFSALVSTSPAPNIGESVGNNNVITSNLQVC